MGALLRVHLSYLFYELIPRFTDQRHLLTVMELCMPNSMSGLLKSRSRPWPHV